MLNYGLNFFSVDLSCVHWKEVPTSIRIFSYQMKTIDLLLFFVIWLYSISCMNKLMKCKGNEVIGVINCEIEWDRSECLWFEKKNFRVFETLVRPFLVECLGSLLNFEYSPLLASNSANLVLKEPSISLKFKRKNHSKTVQLLSIQTALSRQFKIFHEKHC